jgi:hypothetical protein
MPWVKLTGFYKCFKECQVFTAAAPPESNLKTLLWGEIGSIVQKNPGLFADDNVSLTGMSISRGPQEFIKGVTVPSTGTEKEREARFSGKHAPYLLFVIDEGDAVPFEVYKGIESCMSGGHARLLVLFNPRAEAGPTYQMIKKRQANVVVLSAFTHPNVITGDDIFPGAVTQEATVRRIMEWTRTMYEGEKDDGDVFEVPQYLVGVRATALSGELLPPLPGGKRKATDPQFNYMVRGVYPSASENQLISREWVEKARHRHDEFVNKTGRAHPQGIFPKMGLDVADLGIDYNVATFRYGSFLTMPRLWAGVDPYESAIRAAELYKENRAQGCWVDSNGVGAASAPVMVSLGCDAYRIMVTSAPTEAAEDVGEFARQRDQGLWAVREWLRNDPHAALPPDEELIEELVAVKYWPDKNGKIKMSDTDTLRSILKRSPDRLMSLMVTFLPIPDEGGEMSVGNYIEDEEVAYGSY